MTNIQTSDEVWHKLNKMKSKPGESFDEVIKRVLDELKDWRS